MSKLCRACNETKENHEFSKKLKNKDGLYSYCRTCNSKKNKIAYAEKKNEHKIQQKLYREKNRELLREKALIYYYKNKDKILLKVKKYKEKNKQNISFKEAKRRLESPEKYAKINARFKEWTKKNREKLNEYQRNWYKKNKEKRRAHVLVSRAIKKGLLMRSEICEICKKLAKTDGHHENYDLPLNVTWLCKQCHARKSPRTVIKIV